MLDEGGDAAAAAELIAQALEIVPGWAAGWDLLGTYAHKAGRIEEALAAWRRVLALDTGGIFGAELKLAAHGAALDAQQTAVPYVQALFDDYAPRFDTALLQRLDYRVPELLSDMLGVAMALVGATGFAHTIDLGCGTGLMGERLRRLTAELTGVDLSAGMLAECGRRGIYDRLEQAEIAAYLEASGTADLITAADVFAYCGALPPMLAAVWRALAPGGVFAFSLERNDGDADCVLRSSLRYAHSAAATRAALVEQGFEVLAFDEQPIRTDGGAPVTGLLVVALRPKARADDPVATSVHGASAVAARLSD